MTTSDEPEATRESGQASTTTIPFEEYLVQKAWEGLTTGEIHVPLPSGGELHFQWFWMAEGDCNSTCRSYPGIGELHTIGCPNIPRRESVE
jgi:hypothetical protein